MKQPNLDEILAEDLRRRAALAVDYDPIAGGIVGERVEVRFEGRTYRVPATMTADPDYTRSLHDRTAWERLRCRHDFEFWCARCATVKHKITAQDTHFVLNAPQRRVAAVMERQRLAGRPIRMILLKARQWGGSTLVQMYMAWIQSCHRRNWHSLICAHVKDTSAGIRGMYTKLLSCYPEELWEGDESPVFKPFERTQNVREIAGRGCRVTIGSSEAQDSVRGSDYAMAHLSETAFWPATRSRSPQSFIRAVCGAIALEPMTFIVMESTANGVGDYFHSEWLRCTNPDEPGDKEAVFVPWYEIEFYRCTPPDRRAFAASLGEYGRYLWSLGLSLDQIYWYTLKAREYPSEEEMQAEFPTTDTEAFVTTSHGVFHNEHIAALRQTCTAPESVGELDYERRRFLPDAGGCLKIWRMPEPGRDYVAAVDVGGRSRKSDWSVIAVLSHARDAEEKPEVVAQWRGHIDHDLLAARSIALASFYNTALLVVESNTYETAVYGGMEGNTDSNLFILNRVAEAYPNVYRRVSFDSVTRRTSSRVGFHTNRQTKALLIDGLIEAVREGSYTERDTEACNEFSTYELLPNGSYAAREGRHDDILMTRAMALYVLSTTPPPPHCSYHSGHRLGW